MSFQETLNILHIYIYEEKIYIYIFTPLIFVVPIDHDFHS